MLNDESRPKKINESFVEIEIIRIFFLIQVKYISISFEVFLYFLGTIYYRLSFEAICNPNQYPLL